MSALSVIELRHVLEGLRGEERFARVFYRTQSDKILPVERVRYLADPAGAHNMLILEVVEEPAKNASVP